MVPFILFISVAAVALLSIFAMLTIAKKQLRAWRRERDRVAARSAQLAEASRIKAQTAAMLASQAAPRPIVRPAPAPPAPAPIVGLTQVIALLDQSSLFTPLPGPLPQPPSARTRLAKGSVPIPMPNPTAVAPRRPLPLGPFSSVGSLATGRISGAVPPPIPQRRPPRGTR